MPRHLIILDLISLTLQYSVKSTNYEAPDRAIFLASCYLSPLRCKYSFQHPVLKHPQSMFLPKCDTSSFTHTKQRVKLVLHVLIFMFLAGKLEDKIF
jgi:hypothetical protein